MVFDANIDATGNRTDHSIHRTEVSLVSLHNKLIFGTLGIVAVILGIAIAVWILEQKNHQAQEAARRPPGHHLLPRGADPPTR
jgi:hypothetical protein